MNTPGGGRSSLAGALDEGTPKEIEMKTTKTELKAELARLEMECAKIVSSVHGVIPAALANRLWALREQHRRDEAQRVCQHLWPWAGTS